jgi:hypothetical protein
MIPHEQLIAYFENLAAQHKLIAHDKDTAKKRAFLYGDVEMLLEDIAGTHSPGYIMLLETGSGTLDGPDEVNLYDNTEVAFIICKSVREGNRAEQRTTEEACKNLGLQIMKRIQRDRTLEVPEWLMNFDLNRVRYARVFGFGNNHFGFRFEFTITDSAQLTYNPADWSDEPET